MILLTIISQTTDEKEAPFWRAQHPTLGSRIPAGTGLPGLPFPFSLRLLGAGRGRNTGITTGKGVRSGSRSGGHGSERGRQGSEGLRRLLLRHPAGSPQGDSEGGLGAEEHREKMDNGDNRDMAGI